MRVTPKQPASQEIREVPRVSPLTRGVPLTRPPAPPLRHRQKSLSGVTLWRPPAWRPQPLSTRKGGSTSMWRTRRNAWCASIVAWFNPDPNPNLNPDDPNPNPVTLCANPDPHSHYTLTLDPHPNPRCSWWPDSRWSSRCPQLTCRAKAGGRPRCSARRRLRTPCSLLGIW